MSKKKWNFDRRDFLRALLTDTAPEDVPIIFSTDGLYKNLSDRSGASDALGDLIDAIVTAPRDYTIPHRYKITKTATSTRRLSLPHPAAQWDVVEFYKKYDSLICYYCSLSDFSIRKPVKVGSSYFYPGMQSDKNRYKDRSVDTLDVDKVTRNPASYFAYYRYDKFYKFFTSDDFTALEKKFSSMWLLDISSCFDSIYTHTISWAVKDVRHSKDNVKASSFGNDFDKLMQRMNYNETNGICIGPEVSRIFAEVILQAVDVKISLVASERGWRLGADFECRRYVDDFAVFARDKKVAKAICEIVEDELAHFNLRLNREKLDIYRRPFQTKKSQIIAAAASVLSRFMETIRERRADHPKDFFPKKLYRPQKVVRAFLGEIKACCFEHGVGYDMLGGYVISTLARMCQELARGYVAPKASGVNDDDLYINCALVLLEIVYFLYTVYPTVPMSLKVANATLLLCDFFKNRFPERVPFLSQKLSEWVMQVIQGRPEQLSGPKGRLPIETLNIMLAATSLDEHMLIDQDYLESHLFDVNDGDYFTLITCLAYIKDYARYRGIRERIERRIGGADFPVDVCVNSHDAHLVLDLLSCPYLTPSSRARLASKVRAVCGTRARTPQEIRSMVSEMEGKPWFVQWKALDLLNMLRKKQLRPIY